MNALATNPSVVLPGQDPSGAHAIQARSITMRPSTDTWTIVCNEMIRSLCNTFTVGQSRSIYHGISSINLYEFGMEAMPIARLESFHEARMALRDIESVFGTSASILSKILRVSRPMIYHYRDGMIPSVDNLRRLKLIADLANSTPIQSDFSFVPVLKSSLPEGKTLLKLLSERNPDVSLLRRIMARNAADIQKRQNMAEAIAYATPYERKDILRERHAAGRPVYITDPALPGKIIQIRPDKSRIPGRMVNRVFVPEEE
jgi:hypothetical protein